MKKVILAGLGAVMILCLNSCWFLGGGRTLSGGSFFHAMNKDSEYDSKYIPYEDGEFLLELEPKSHSITDNQSFDMK